MRAVVTPRMSCPVRHQTKLVLRQCCHATGGNERSWHRVREGGAAMFRCLAGGNNVWEGKGNGRRQVSLLEGCSARSFRPMSRGMVTGLLGSQPATGNTRGRNRGLGINSLGSHHAEGVRELGRNGKQHAWCLSWGRQHSKQCCLPLMSWEQIVVHVVQACSGICRRAQFWDTFNPGQNWGTPPPTITIEATALEFHHHHSRPSRRCQGMSCFKEKEVWADTLLSRPKLTGWEAMAHSHMLQTQFSSSLPACSCSAATRLELGREE